MSFKILPNAMMKLTGNTDQNRMDFNWRNIIVLAFLITLGSYGNYENVELFFGVNFIFGSIATMLTVTIFGTAWGVFSSVIIGSYTVILWGHPYALIIFTLEALFVGLFYCNFKKENIVLGDTLFWMLVGMPMVYLFYSKSLGLPDVSVQIIALKQTLNGIFNTLVASLLIQIGIRDILLGYKPYSNWKLSIVFNNVLAIFILVPMLFLITLINSNERNQLDEKLSEKTGYLAQNALNIISGNLTKQAAVFRELFDGESSHHYSEVLWHKLLERWSGVLARFEGLYLLDESRQIEYYYPENLLSDSSNSSRLTEYISIIKQSKFDDYMILSGDKNKSNEIIGTHIALAIKLKDECHLIVELGTKFFDDLLIAKQGLHTNSTLHYNENIIWSPGEDFQNYHQDNNSQYLLPDDRSLPVMVQWQNAYWEQTVSLEQNRNLKYSLRMPIKKYIWQLQQDQAKNMSIALFTIILGLLCAPIVTRYLVNPLFTLSKTAGSLAENYNLNNAVWPQTRITEINYLVLQFRTLIHSVMSKHKQLQDAKQEQKVIADELLIFIKTANAPIIGVDGNGVITEWNDYMEGVTGYTKSEVKGMNLISNYFNNESTNLATTMLHKALKGISAENYEVCIRVKHGGWASMLLSTTTHRNIKGEIIGAMSVGQNITERKLVENALRDSESRFTALTEASPVAIYIKDLKGRYLMMNSTFRSWHGGDSNGNTAYDLFKKEDAVLDVSHDQEVMTSGKALEWEVDMPSISGESMIIHSVKFPIIAPSGDLIGLGGLNIDITSRKQAEVQVIHSSKLATVGEMATSVAHELNQPLNVIRMASANCVRKIQLGSADNEYLIEKLERISSQTERAANIIDHMRIFGRKDSDGPCLICPSDALEDAMGLMGEQLRLSDIDVVKNHIKECCPSVMGIKLNLEQVYLNLLTNAKDAILTSESLVKKIILTIDIIEFKGVLISIEDTGGGIAEDNIDRIFEPFYTTKKVGHGTGLGLSISYGIISDMGGTITARNGEYGAIFSILLPLPSSVRTINGPEKNRIMVTQVE